MDDEEEEEEEQVMSEVHLGCPPAYAGPYISRFTFFVPPALDKADGINVNMNQIEASSGQKLCSDYNGEPAASRQTDCSLPNDVPASGHLVEEHASSGTIMLDKDGDLVLCRRRNKDETCLEYEIAIRHNITSSLRAVGLQVWRAALVLTDFVLHKSFTSAEFSGITAIELGAGTGLVGLALARTAKTVFITDKGIEVLDNCAANAHLNFGMLGLHENEVRIHELDWIESWPPPAGKYDPSQPRSKYLWTSEEIEEAERSTVLLAADVIYSDELTELLFSTLEKLMSRGSEKVLYLTLEKRYNFSLDDLDVVANSYACFRSFLKDNEELEGLDGTPLRCFRGKRIELATIPQYIREYERGNDVEMWEISCI